MKNRRKTMEKRVPRGVKLRRAASPAVARSPGCLCCSSAQARRSRRGSKRPRARSNQGDLTSDLWNILEDYVVYSIYTIIYNIIYNLLFVFK